MKNKLTINGRKKVVSKISQKTSPASIMLVTMKYFRETFHALLVW